VILTRSSAILIVVVTVQPTTKTQRAPCEIGVAAISRGKYFKKENISQKDYHVITKSQSFEKFSAVLTKNNTFAVNYYGVGR